MLVCSVSQLARRAGIAAGIVEAASALDAPGTGNVVFATLVDDPASVGEIVDAFLGEIMLEPAFADTALDGSVPVVYSADIIEAATAGSTQDGGIPGLSPPLDAVASVTGAWSFGRNLLTSFGAGTRYTTVSGNVDSLKDQKPSSPINFNQSNATLRPVLATAFPAGVLCADFDGADDHLTTASAISNFISSSSGAMVASVIIDAVTLNNANVYLNHDILADNGGYMGLTASGTTSSFNFSSFNYPNWTTTGGAGTTGTAYVVMWRHHGGNLYFSINGGTEVSVASGNTGSMSGLLIMAWAYGGYCNMKLAEAFTTSDGSQTAALAAAIANMKTYVGA